VLCVGSGPRRHWRNGRVRRRQARYYTVVIEGTAYAPETLTVKRRDTVVWVNKDPFPHTVTAKSAFDSYDIAPGKQWKYTPRKLGEYPYTCTLHPNMKGTLDVE
jgi:plastocyanin